MDQFIIRKATEDDCDSVFELVNEVTARQAIFAPEPLIYEAHVKWFEAALCLETYCLYMIEMYEEIGIYIKYHIKNNAYIGVVIHPEYRCCGIGAKVLKESSDDF